MNTQNTRIRLTLTLMLLVVWLVLGSFSRAHSDMAQAQGLTQAQVNSAMLADYAALPAPLTVDNVAQWNALTYNQQQTAAADVAAELTAIGATTAQINTAQIENEYYFAKDVVWPIGLPALSLLYARRRRKGRHLLCPTEIKSEGGQMAWLWLAD
jgi:hypothetical protein